ncbi:hypothetical protein [Corallococcus llansteffanensis]|uniref:hypothetical protein n=1 Tax=Corallococcus llansteffanensis TaxID=2316731 RepID=UPI001FCA016B|nr:hypothetical protein [Corallococcus llansteffanensis]
MADLQPGDLVLYVKAGDPDRVMVHVGAGVVMGASGDGSATRTLEDAARAGACVKAVAHEEYRPDIFGFRCLPFVS